MFERGFSTAAWGVHGWVLVGCQQVHGPPRRIGRTVAALVLAPASSSAELHKRGGLRLRVACGQARGAHGLRRGRGQVVEQLQRDGGARGVSAAGWHRSLALRAAGAAPWPRRCDRASAPAT